MTTPTPDAPTGHGGRRAGSGRKPNAARTSDDEKFSAARARRERANASRAEIALSAEAGALVSREAVRQACATLLAIVAQSLRSVPDNIERTLALQPEAVEAVAQQIDAALTEAANALRAIHEQT
jgi:phage terminase Nu1 subunit (DNA packaging protein)